MDKAIAVSAEGNPLKGDIPSSGKDTRRIIVLHLDSSAVTVSCDVLKYLSMKKFRTFFIERQDPTSFRALHCKSLGFNVAVKADTIETDVCMVDFFLNDHARHNPLICTEEQVWRLLREGEEVGKIEQLLSVEDEMKVRNMADNAFKALRCAFRKKAKAELNELHLQFGRPTSGHWMGKLVIASAITSRECRVTWSGSTKNSERSDYHLAMLTENFFS